MIFRFATVQDSATLLEIYAQYIETPITFECALPTEQAFADRIHAKWSVPRINGMQNSPSI